MKKLALALLLWASASAFADDPLAGIGELLVSGRAAEGRARLLEARKAFVAQGDDHGEAASLLLLGMTAVNLGDVAAARSELDEAATRLLALDEHFAAWFALNALAKHEALHSRYDEAIALHERALDVLRRAGEPGSRLSLRVIALILPVFGGPAGLGGSLATNSEMARPILLLFAGIMNRADYGQALVEANELVKAEEQLTQAESQATMLFGDALAGLIAPAMADLRRRQWRFDEARRYYEVALDNVGALPGLFARDAWVELDVLRKYADLEVLSGRVDEALKVNDRARALAQIASPKREAGILEERGRLLQLAGRYTEAEKAFLVALAFAEKRGQADHIAHIHEHLGSLHYYSGNFGAAAAHLVKAIEKLQAVKDPYLEAAAWIQLTQVFMVTESWNSAAEAIAKTRELAKKSSFPIAGAMADLHDALRRSRLGENVDVPAAFAAWMAMPDAKAMMWSPESEKVFRAVVSMDPQALAPDPALVTGAAAPLFRPMALMLKGVPLAARGDHAAARKLWNEALGATNLSRDLRVGILALIGASYWKEGNADEAIRSFKQAADVLEMVATHVRVEEMIAGYLGSPRRAYFEILVEMLVREGRVAEAFEQTERARARAFLQLIGNRRVSDRGANPELVREADIQRRRIAAIEDEVRNAPTARDAEKLKAQLGLARTAYEALMVRVKASNPEYAAMTSVETLPVDAIRKDLPDETTLISYFRSPNATHAWVIDRTSLEYVRLPVDARGMRRVVCWATQFRPPEVARGAKPPGEECSDAAAASEAYAMLIAPLRSKIRNDRLVIVPHRELHYVPFAALLDAERNRHLVEDFTILYAPSATAWRFLRRHESAVEGRALVLGNPATPGMRLPGAEREAAIVAKHLGTEPLIGTAARESLIHTLEGKIDLLHVAAHAAYDGANPLFSHIALAAGGRDGDDGELKAQEILSDVDLTGVNLVVLSACNTAMGKPSDGDEIVGLTRSLLYAGTPGVVSTLWPIDDVASTALMDAFYERFVAGASAAEALRAAQLSMLRGDAFRSPEFWAAFTLTGDPQGRWKR